VTLLERPPTGGDSDPPSPAKEGLPDPLARGEGDDPSAGFYVTGGTMPRAAASYVVRRADADLVEGLRDGEFCYILNTRQIGKSSLILRAASRLREEGATVAVLDLTSIGQNVTPAQWYNGLLLLLSEQIGLEDELEDFWDEHGHLAPLQRFFGALRRVVLPRIAERPGASGRLILFVDEIDAVRSLPFSADEFFIAVRECYNRRAHDPTYQALTFCLVGVATPADLIQDTRLSPFNIGRRIPLTDFTPEEAAPLAGGLGPQGPALLDRVLYWTAGHPYLTQRLLRTLAEEGVAARTAIGPTDVDVVCNRLFFRHGERDNDDNLAFVRNRLLRSEADTAALLEKYWKVLVGRRVHDDDTDPLCGFLKLSGIVRVLPDGRMAVRNRIYGRVFHKGWVESHLPEADVLRQRAAYRRGVTRTALYAGIAVCFLALMVAYAFEQKGIAERALAAAEDSAQRATENSAEARREKLRAASNARRAEALRQAAARNARVAAAETRRARKAAEEARQNQELARRSEESARANERLARERAELAKSSEQKATDEANRARQLLYVANINLMQKRYQDADIESVRQLLEHTRPMSGHPDLRGFEWRYLSRLCDPTGQELAGQTSTVRAVAFSPDGQWIASGGGDGTILLHPRHLRQGEDAASAQPADSTPLPARRLRGHAAPVTALAFSPDGTKLISAGGRHVLVWDVRTAAGAQLPGEMARGIQAIALTHDGNMLIAGDEGGELHRWDLAAGRDLGPWGSVPSAVRALDCSPDGRWVAVGRRDQHVSLWNAHDGSESTVFRGGHATDVRGVAFSPDSRSLASCGDSNIVIWNVREGTVRQTISGHAAYVYGVAFTPSGSVLVSASWDRTVRAWDADTGEELRVLRGHSGAAQCVAVAPDGRTIASGGADHRVRLWDVTRDDESAALVERGRSQGVMGMAVSEDERTLAAADDNGEVKLWDLVTHRVERRLHGHKNKVKSVLFFRGDSRLLSTSDDGTLKVWDRKTGACLKTLTGHTGGVNMAAMLPDGRHAVSASDDGRAILWDLDRGTAVRTFHGHQDEVNCVAVFPDGSKVATGSDDRTARVWDVASGRVVAILPVEASVNAVAVLPDGERIATGSSDDCARLWYYPTQTCRTVMKGHIREVWCLTLTPDGKRLVTGSHDGTAKLWDIETGREMLTFRAHQREIKSVAFAPRADFLLTGSRDGAIRLWDGRAREAGKEGRRYAGR